MLRQIRKAWRPRRASLLLAVAPVALIVAGSLAAARPGHRAHARGSVLSAVIDLARGGKVARNRGLSLAARVRPHVTVSLDEHSVRQGPLRRQGGRAAKRGVSGSVILDFGQPAYNGHTYGTYLFSGRFAGNKAITQAMYSYAYGYNRCLRRGSNLRITLARGTSNYHPQVP